jgi:hypothetical protein
MSTMSVMPKPERKFDVRIEARVEPALYRRWMRVLRHKRSRELLLGRRFSHSDMMREAMIAHCKREEATWEAA